MSLTPLYGTFMARLSGCIYEWDEEDYNLLMRAKGGELTQAGVRNPSSTAIKKPSLGRSWHGIAGGGRGAMKGP